MPSEIFCSANSADFLSVFPEDWVYQSAFGERWKTAIEERTEDCPLDHLAPLDLKTEVETLRRYHQASS